MSEDKIAEIQAWLEGCQWRFAKSMPRIPHEYIVESDTPEMHRAVVDYIHATGQEELFFRKTFKYIILGDYKYWTARSLYSEGFVINRKYATSKN